jgi:pantoate--beta-alanine ligase
MKIVTKKEDMKAIIRDLKSQNKTVGFVPTMGYLHEGHLSLVRESRKRMDWTVVSIFVNPTQFGPKEDFNQYPRDFKRDKALLEQEGVDYVFYPDAEKMYPEGYKTYVEVHDLQDRLCGRSRPGHFRGVCTVVLKLFQIIKPDVAFFGQKDAQQTIILKKMVRDLDLDVKIEVMPTIRASDGLALSSRNSYLSPEERRAALILIKSLEEAKRMVEKGQRVTDQILKRMKEMVEKEPLAKVDYIEIVSLDDLAPLSVIKKEALIAIAAYIGKTRLIDNVIIIGQE